MSNINDTTTQIIDKSSDKYKIALKFINKILTNIGKNEIDDLTKFVNVSRADVISDTNKKTFEDMQDDLLELYDKTICGWYRRNKMQHYILSFIRGMCTQLGLAFTYKELKKQENKVVVSTMYYSIK